MLWLPFVLQGKKPRPAKIRELGHRLQNSEKRASGQQGEAAKLLPVAGQKRGGPCHDLIIDGNFDDESGAVGR